MQRIIWLGEIFVKNMANINIKDLAYAFSKNKHFKIKNMV